MTSGRSLPPLDGSRPQPPLGLRRAMAAIAVAALTVLAALVALGMATGTHRHFDQGVTSLAAVLAVQILGVVCLALLTIGLRFWVAVWRGERPWHLSRWSVAIALCWLVWAFLRVGEYAS